MRPRPLGSSSFLITRRKPAVLGPGSFIHIPIPGQHDVLSLKILACSIELTHLFNRGNSAIFGNGKSLIVGTSPGVCEMEAGRPPFWCDGRSKIINTWVMGAGRRLGTWTKWLRMNETIRSPLKLPVYDFDLRATHARALLPAALA